MDYAIIAAGEGSRLAQEGVKWPKPLVRLNGVALIDRLIDIDLLLYGEEVIDQPGLQIPHPLMHRRAFVMTPMAEIAPEVVHPVLGKTMKALSDLLESENAG